MAIFSLAVHGGAGTITKNLLTPELERSYLNALEEALKEGYSLLEKNGSAVDAVTASVISLENNILFNAGKGSVFTKNGKHEMDASLMDGSTLAAGAVAGIYNIKNPVLLAKEVMDHTEHVLLSGMGAMEFAKQTGILFEPDNYFYSQFRYDQWMAVKNSDIVELDHNIQIEKKFGTVGAVACDIHGNIAAATSTGGMTNKQFGRVGDTPLIGCGTYANNKTCAISCTGHGELFMKAVAAYDVSCLMEYKGYHLQQAMDIVVNDKLIKMKGEGGMIGTDANGNIAMLFNSEGMYRGMQNALGEKQVAIYR
jgi:L-asparaginase / beta-aspartyl-peptidase